MKGEKAKSFHTKDFCTVKRKHCYASARLNWKRALDEIVVIKANTANSKIPLPLGFLILSCFFNRLLTFNS